MWNFNESDFSSFFEGEVLAGCNFEELKITAIEKVDNAILNYCDLDINNLPEPIKMAIAYCIYDLSGVVYNRVENQEESMYDLMPLKKISFKAWSVLQRHGYLNASQNCGECGC